MDNPNENLEAPKKEAAAADQETETLSRQEDELQDSLDEKIADALLSSEMEVDISGEDEPEQRIDPDIIQQTIDAEATQEVIDTRVLRDFDEGIITIDRDGYIRYINPSASLILGLTDNAVGKKYREVFGRENDAVLSFLVKSVA